MQCADPAAGSSGTPCPGAKKRETKPQSHPGAVAIIPKRSVVASLNKSGLRLRAWSSLAKINATVMKDADANRRADAYSQLAAAPPGPKAAPLSASCSCSSLSAACRSQRSPLSYKFFDCANG